jgi:protein SCO1/2
MGSWFWIARASSRRGHTVAARQPGLSRARQQAVLGLSVTAMLALSGCASHSSLPVLGAVPDFTLTDQTGSAFASASTLAGHVWVADFFFTTCPGPCPRMSSQMHQVQTALADQGARMVSITVDPEHDTPQTLTEYAQHFQAQPGVWFFLTGPREALNHLDRDVFKLGQVDGSLDHSTRFILVDKKSQVRGYYLTSEPDAITRLIADAKSLL